MSGNQMNKAQKSKKMEQNKQKLANKNIVPENKMSENDVRNNKNKKENKNSSQIRHIDTSDVKANYHLIPLFIILCILPLIVRLNIYETNLSQFAWFSSEDKAVDFFLINKQIIFIIVAAYMALVIAYKAYSERRAMKFAPIFIPLAVYALLSLFSAIFSDYISFSFRGSFELFESIFVLLGYALVVYFAFLCVKAESDFKRIYIFILVITIVLGLIGVLQYSGMDLYNSDIGYNLVVPKNLQDGYKLDLVFGDKYVFMTLYNPNYVGVYTAFMIPIVFIMLFFQKNILLVISSIVSVVLMAISLRGSQSMAGLIGLLIAVFFILIFMWRNLIKRFYITIPVSALLILGLIFLNNYTDHRYENELKRALQVSKTEQSLTYMETKDDHIALTYKGYDMQLKMNKQSESLFTVLDKDYNPLEVDYDPSIALYRINNENYADIYIGLDNQYTGAFYLQIEGRKWRFTNVTEDGTYYYVNAFNKLDKLITAPSAMFTGFEGYASGRGYIWSRTIPMLKDYIFLGSGPDTYTMAFPQQDYMNLQLNGLGGSMLLTKPHSLYLQMAVQTGLLSLIAFLVFYLMYFVSSFRLYIRGRFTSYYAKFGVAIFIGTISYMATGVSNDSTLNTAPTFWVLMGVGIALNYKAKPLILDEVKEIKAQKAAARATKKEALSGVSEGSKSDADA